MASEDAHLIPLSQLANILSGYAFKGVDLGSTGHRVVKIAEIEPPRINLESCDRIPAAKVRGLDRFKLEDLDILVAMTGATTGKAGRLRTSEPVYLNQRVAKISALAGKKYDDFIWAIVSQPGFDQLIMRNAHGSAQPNVSAEGIGRILVPQFAPDEQLAIGNFVRLMDDKIELNRRMNATLEAMARALFQSWFVDFDPVRAKAAGQTPAGMGKTTAALFPAEFEDSELGRSPAGWEIRGLDDTAEFLNGLALQKYPPSTPETLPVIKIAQLRAGHAEGADRCGDNLASEYVVRNGDVLFSWSGSLLVDLWCGGKGALNQHLFKVSSDQFPKWFYYLWTLHHLEGFRRIASSKATTMGHIQRHHLRAAKVLVPAAALLRRMTDIMQPLIDQMVSLKLQSRTLAEIRDTLLPRLLSGQMVHPQPLLQGEVASK